jgi:hypothetical protein
MTFTAPTSLGTWNFQGWLVDGNWITTPSIDLYIDSDFHMIEPVYQDWQNWNPPERPISEEEPEENPLDDEPPHQELEF